MACNCDQQQADASGPKSRHADASNRGFASYPLFFRVSLRSKLSKRGAVTEEEKGRLVKLGRKLGPALKEVIGIVSPRTFLRWANREKTEEQQPRKKGRPRKP